MILFILDIFCCCNDPCMHRIQLPDTDKYVEHTKRKEGSQRRGWSSSGRHNLYVSLFIVILWW